MTKLNHVTSLEPLELDQELEQHLCPCGMVRSIYQAVECVVGASISTCLYVFAEGTMVLAHMPQLPKSIETGNTLFTYANHDRVLRPIRRKWNREKKFFKLSLLQ